MKICWARPKRDARKCYGNHFWMCWIRILAFWAHVKNDNSCQNFPKNSLTRYIMFLYIHPKMALPTDLVLSSTRCVWLLPLQVHTAVEGSNASILAYGQTSSGKTHSVTGTLNGAEMLPRPNRKVVFQPPFFRGELLNFGGVLGGLSQLVSS